MSSSPRSDRRIFISKALLESIRSAILENECLSCAGEDVIAGFAWARGEKDSSYAYVALDRTVKSAKDDLYVVQKRVIFVDLLNLHRGLREPLYLFWSPDRPGKIGESSALDRFTKEAGEPFDEAIPFDAVS